MGGAMGAEKSQLITNLNAGKDQVLVVYGTSLTEKGGWVADLQQALEARYPGQIAVINSGGSGQNSNWGLAKLEERVLQKQPDTVFIEFSINDAAERFNITPQKARQNLETMIQRIQAQNPEAEIILMTMTPGDKHPEGHMSYRKDIEDHYQMYRDVADEYGFLLIDHYPAWKALQAQYPGLFSQYVGDSIHPSRQGNTAVVSPVIIEAIGLPAPDNAPQQSE